MNIRIHSRFRSGLVLLALVASATIGAVPAFAAAKCDALFLDGAALESARTNIDNACVCAAFDGSEGNGRSEYKACVEAQIRLAVESTLIRKVCKGNLKKMYAASVCGTGDAELAPCIETTASGKRRCRIRTEASCEERSGLVCAGRSTCVDAADTTGDLVVDENDSGLCIPTGPGTTLPPETTTTLPPDTTTTSTTEEPTTTTEEPTSTTEEPTTTTTEEPTTTTEEPTTTTTLPVFCGEDSPDVVVEVMRHMGPEYYEIVQEGPECPQDRGNGGCHLNAVMDGSEDTIFFADNSIDQRVCSQDDAALSYHWDFFHPVTLNVTEWVPSWVDRDSPTLVIPPSSFPALEDTIAGADTFWRVRLTVTPIPLEGESITPAPTVLWFRFEYQATRMRIEDAIDLWSPYCPGDSACKERIRWYCEEFPGRCPWTY